MKKYILSFIVTTASFTTLLYTHSVNAQNNNTSPGQGIIPILETKNLNSESAIELRWGSGKGNNPFQAAQLSNCKNLIEITADLQGSADLKDWKFLKTVSLGEGPFKKMGYSEKFSTVGRDKYFWRLGNLKVSPKDASVKIVCHKGTQTKCFKNKVGTGHESDPVGPCPNLTFAKSKVEFVEETIVEEYNNSGAAHE